MNQFQGSPFTGYAPPLARTTLNQVLSLLGLAALFTAGGAFAAPYLGGGAFLLGLIGGLVSLLILTFVREHAPWNLIFLFLFASLEGLVLGGILQTYLAAGLGDLVLAAASATGVVVLVAGGIGYTTKRNLAGLGGFLFIGLLVVILASVVGLFVHLTVLEIGISAAAALLFTGFLVFDLNRIARTPAVSRGTAIMLAVSVYLDVFNLFLNILNLLGFASRRS
jgi:modulator of FtsH protease